MSETQSNSLDFLNRLVGNRSFAEQERERGATPVVSPQTGTGGQGSSLMASLRSQLGEAYRQDNPRDRFNNQLLDFGLSLMTSRNPRFLGALGESVQAQREAARQRNADMRQLLETESQASHREGQLSVAQAELRLKEAEQRYAQAPDNPINRLRLAQEQESLASAKRAEAQARTAGQRTPHYERVVQGGQAGVYDVTNNRFIPFGQGTQFQSAVPRVAAGAPYIVNGRVEQPMSDNTTQVIMNSEGKPITPAEFEARQRSTLTQRAIIEAPETYVRARDRAERDYAARKNVAGMPMYDEAGLAEAMRGWTRRYLNTNRALMPPELAAQLELEAADPTAGTSQQTPTSRIDMRNR